MLKYSFLYIWLETKHKIFTDTHGNHERNPLWYVCVCVGIECTKMSEKQYWVELCGQSHKPFALRYVLHLSLSLLRL
jgi:hypothetical protein